MSLPLYFETVTIERQHVRIWLRHPYRMVSCDLNDLINRAKECKHDGNRFTLRDMPYKEYKSLPPVQDCKMPVLIEVNACDSFDLPTSVDGGFTLEREEFERILSTTRSVMSLL